jgi:hypothetical protein
MRQIIGGKIYDTAKAVLVARYQFSNEKNILIGDMNWVYEELYRTPNGRYFLYASETCMTEHAGKDEAAMKLMTLAEEDVIAWAERRTIDPDLLTKYIRIKEA